MSINKIYLLTKKKSIKQPERALYANQTRKVLIIYQDKIVISLFPSEVKARSFMGLDFNTTGEIHGTDGTLDTRIHINIYIIYRCIQIYLCMNISLENKKFEHYTSNSRPSASYRSGFLNIYKSFMNQFSFYNLNPHLQSKKILAGLILCTYHFYLE